MRALLHIRVTPDGKAPLLSAIEEPYKLLDLKEMDSADGDHMVLITVILAEDWSSWRLLIASFLTRINGILENQNMVLLSTLIIDAVNLTESGILFEPDLLQFLGKRRMTLQVLANQFAPPDFE